MDAIIWLKDSLNLCSSLLHTWEQKICNKSEMAVWIQSAHAFVFWCLSFHAIFILFLSSLILPRDSY